MKNCNKKSYLTENQAIDALIEARIRYNTNAAVRVYQCESCLNWHLTSVGKLQDELKNVLVNGAIDKSREALHWENKLKNKY